VQRGELGEPPQPLLDGVVDDGRLAELRPAVYDAVRDGVCRHEDVDGLRLAALDERELEARRTGVDD
jgi:hypothetical protein